MIRDLILKNRSYRRFYQETEVGLDTLKELLDLARLSASAANRQPLKFILSCEPEKNALVFSNIGLAGNPVEGERPSAYIIILGDTEVSDSFSVDHGIAAQSILLGAAEKGLGGCMIGAIQKAGLGEALAIPRRYKILLVLAIGKPRETAVIETYGGTGETRGWWDDDGVRHVPKRRLEDIIVG